MESTLIMDTVTSIDCGVITVEGALVGHSFNPTLFVTGGVTEDEGVVCDFGTLKKRVKAEIDDRDSGIDHKIWVPCNKNVHFEEDSETPGNVVLVTPLLRLKAPRDAFVLIRPSFSRFSPVGHSLLLNSYTFQYDESKALEIQDDEGRTNLFAIPSLFASVVSSLLTKRLPEFKFVIGLRNEPYDFRDPIFLGGKVLYPGKASLFRYTHGLPNSSSWGCQNIGHGHMSFVQCFGENDTPLLTSCSWQLAMTLNGSYFCNTNDVSKEESVDDTPPAISYTTGRGTFGLKFLHNAKMASFPEDTTVENLAYRIVSANVQHLKENGVAAVYISEGLNKGCFVWVDSVTPAVVEPESSPEATQGAA